MKLYIATPSNRPVSPQHMLSVMSLRDALNKARIPSAYEFRANCSLLPSARHSMLRYAIENGFTHALMIDDDMAFQPQAFTLMTTQLQGPSLKFPMTPVGAGGGQTDPATPEQLSYAIIAANYVTKPGAKPQKPVACDIDGNTLYSNERIGFEEISSIGLGFALVNLEVLKTVPLPWFETPWVGPEAMDTTNYEGETMGEDTYFCRKLRESGHRIFVDHDASKHVGHIGEAVYTEANSCENADVKKKTP